MTLQKNTNNQIILSNSPLYICVTLLDFMMVVVHYPFMQPIILIIFLPHWYMNWKQDSYAINDIA